MDTWTLQMGFPVVNVTRFYDRNEARLGQVEFICEFFVKKAFEISLLQSETSTISIIH